MPPGNKFGLREERVGGTWDFPLSVGQCQKIETTLSIKLWVST